MVPYTQSTSESFKNICQRYGIQVHLKGGTTLKNLLVSPKDKDSITKMSSVTYWFRCDSNDCEDEYTGESSRMFGERYKEHLKAPEQHWPHNICGKFQDHKQGGPQYGRNNQGDHVHKSYQSYFEKEYWEVQPATPFR